MPETYTTYEVTEDIQNPFYQPRLSGAWYRAPIIWKGMRLCLVHSKNHIYFFKIKDVSADACHHWDPVYKLIETVIKEVAPTLEELMIIHRINHEELVTEMVRQKLISEADIFRVAQDIIRDEIAKKEGE